PFTKRIPGKAQVRPEVILVHTHDVLALILRNSPAGRLAGQTLNSQRSVRTPNWITKLAISDPPRRQQLIAQARVHGKIRAHFPDVLHKDRRFQLAKLLVVRAIRYVSILVRQEKGLADDADRASQVVDQLLYAHPIRAAQPVERRD